MSDEEIVALTARWPAPRRVRAYCTTRVGGFSVGEFASLNLANHVGDEPDAVRRNRDRLLAALCVPREPLWLGQVHGCDVVEASTVREGHRADGAWTAEEGIVCAVLTADCLPVLLCDTSGEFVAAVHAGWRGLAGEILPAAVSALPVAPSAILAWIGPGIGTDAYEVDGEVREAFAGDRALRGAFRPARHGHWHMSLDTVARIQLEQAGVGGVFGGEFCTYSDQERFFSYRRDGRCGRMATLIWHAEVGR